MAVLVLILLAAEAAEAVIMAVEAELQHKIMVQVGPLEAEEALHILVAL
jgi:hypothetical protein